MKNQVQLITYADRLTAGGLDDLAFMLQRPLFGLFSGVHILPFYYPIDGRDTFFAQLKVKREKTMKDYKSLSHIRWNCKYHNTF